MPQMHRIAERLFNTPLMLDAGKAAIISEGFAGRVLGNGVTVNNLIAVEDGGAEMGVISNRLQRRAEKWGDSLLHVTDGVAIIEVEGSLVHKGSWVGRSSGQTSYEGIAAQVAEAAGMFGVKGVVFEIDSFGGEVAGAFDIAEAIHDLGQDVPTMAILTDHACSAGYLLASACHEIVMPETGIAGSIGVVMLHADWSQHLENEGVAVTLLHDGAHKVDGNPYEALPESVRDRLQGQLADARQLFAETVGRYRGDRFNAAAALATEALTYHGREALDLGLVDAVARPRKAFEAFLDQVNEG